MGELRHIFTNATRLLPPRATVGRNPNCDVCLRDRQASGVHAELRWSDDHWEVVDLGSRNGTRVAGQQLEAREPARLEGDAVVSFGSEAESWTLSSSEAPCAFARGEDFDVPLIDGELRLPSGVGVRITVNPETGIWSAEYEGYRHPVANGDFLAVLGHWRIFLPSVDLPPTERRLRICDAQLEVCHDPTEEFVTVRVVPPQSPPIDLAPRAHHALILELVRVRLEDQAGGRSAHQSGWIYREDLADRLGIRDEKQVNVWIHRLRQQLEELGFVDADNIVERQPRTGNLRIGLEDIHIRRI